MGFLASIFTGGGGFGGDIDQNLSSAGTSTAAISNGTVLFGSKGITNTTLIAGIAAAVVVVWILKK